MNYATVELDQRVWFNSSQMSSPSGYLTGRIYYLNEVKITCSDTSATINNVQVNITNLEDDIPAVGYHKTYAGGNGTYTRNIDTRITYHNKYSSSRTYNTCHLQAVITWESANNNTYIQVEITPKQNEDIDSVIARPSSPIDDAIAMKTIIDALAESEDIQGILDYLQTLGNNVQTAVNYITAYYPVLSQRLADVASLQLAANEKLQDIYHSLMTWYVAWIAEKTHEADVASQAESQIANQQSQQESIEADMTYETIDSGNVDNNAIDIIDNQVINQRIIGNLWEWLSHPLVLPFLVTSVTFAVIGFVLYGKHS